jgi:hypothetical protein
MRAEHISMSSKRRPAAAKPSSTELIEADGARFRYFPTSKYLLGSLGHMSDRSLVRKT